MLNAHPCSIVFQASGGVRQTVVRPLDQLEQHCVATLVWMAFEGQPSIRRLYISRRARWFEPQHVVVCRGFLHGHWFMSVFKRSP